MIMLISITFLINDSKYGKQSKNSLYQKIRHCLKFLGILFVHE